MVIDTSTNLIQFLQGTHNGLGVGTNLKYPIDLDTSGYYMMLQFVRYERPNIFARGFNRADGGISLPLPKRLIDTQSINYDSSQQGAAIGAAIESSIAGGKTGGNTISSLVTGALTGALGTGVGAGVSNAEWGVSLLGTSLNNVLSLQGIAVNPFLTVLFNSPTFKQHEFAWTFTARNKKESDAIVNVVNAFKFHSLPDTTAAVAGTLLSYPDMLYISILPDNVYMYKFKPCVINSVSVNYAGADQPSFFDTSKAPAFVTLSITLLEIEYHLKSDWAVNADGILTQKDR